MTSEISLVDVTGSATDFHNARLFTDAELTDLATPAGDKISAALKAGDRVLARELCLAARDGHFPLAFGYFNWNGRMLAHVYQAYGLQAFVDCIDDSLPPWLRPLVELFRNGVTREAVSILVQHWRLSCKHIGPVVETDDTLSFAVDVFDDYWRLNQYGELSDVVQVSVVVDSAHADGAGSEPFSVLAQAVLRAEALMTNWLGYPAFTVDFKANGEPCQVTIHKAPLDVPEDRFQRIHASRDARRIRGAVGVNGGRLFSPAELARLGCGAFDLALKAIDEADLAMAIGYAQQSKNEWYPAHHALRDWITGMLSFVYRRYGVDHTHEAVKEAYEKHNARLTLDGAAQQNIREQVIGLAAGFLQHAMRFRIEEDSDRFNFITEPCGSGGRLLDEGAYAWPKNFALVKERHESTFYLEDFPVYCMHCPSTNIQIFDRGGPYFLLVDGELMTVPDGNCSFSIFKNPDAIPERFYARAGRAKPGCGSCS